MLRWTAWGKPDPGPLLGDPVSPREAPEMYRELGSSDCDRLTAVFDWSRL